MGKIRILKEGDFKYAPKGKTKIYPVTLMEAVYDSDGTKLTKVLENISSGTGSSSYTDLSDYAKLSDSNQQITASSFTGTNFAGTDADFSGDVTIKGSLTVGTQSGSDAEVLIDTNTSSTIQFTDVKTGAVVSVPLTDNNTVAMATDIQELDSTLTDYKESVEQTYAKLTDSSQKIIAGAVNANKIAVDYLTASGSISADGSIRVNDVCTLEAANDTALTFSTADSDDAPVISLPLSSTDTIALLGDLDNYATKDALQEFISSVNTSLDLSPYALLDSDTQKITASSYSGGTAYLETLLLYSHSIAGGTVSVAPVTSTITDTNTGRSAKQLTGISFTHEGSTAEIQLTSGKSEQIAFISDLESYITQDSLTEKLSSYVLSDNSDGSLTTGIIDVGEIISDIDVTKSLQINDGETANGITANFSNHTLQIHITQTKDNNTTTSIFTVPTTGGELVTNSTLSSYATLDDLNNYVTVSSLTGTISMGGLKVSGNAVVTGDTNLEKTTVGGDLIINGDVILHQDTTALHPLTIQFYGGGTAVLPIVDGGETKTIAYQDTKAVTSEERVTLEVETGTSVFDTDLLKPVWYTGSGWVDATGTTI